MKLCLETNVYNLFFFKFNWGFWSFLFSIPYRRFRFNLFLRLFNLRLWWRRHIRLYILLLYLRLSNWHKILINFLLKVIHLPSLRYNFFKFWITILTFLELLPEFLLLFNLNFNFGLFLCILCNQRFHRIIFNTLTCNFCGLTIAILFPTLIQKSKFLRIDQIAFPSHKLKVLGW